MKADGEIGTKAMLWHSVVTAGLARGYAELGNAFAEGIEANEARAGAFQNFVNDYRRRTRINAIDFSEGVGKIQALITAQPTVNFDFPLPSGNDKRVAGLGERSYWEQRGEPNTWNGRPDVDARDFLGAF